LDRDHEGKVKWRREKKGKKKDSWTDGCPVWELVGEKNKTEGKRERENSRKLQ